MASRKQWPGISVSEEDSEIIEIIRKQEGILRGIQMKELLMISASLAVKRSAPSDNKDYKATDQKMHPTLLNSDSYDEYRQFIALIYYLTRGKEDLKNMSDTSDMVSNFVDYAHRGLLLLKTNYLDSKDADRDIVNDFVGLLSKTD